MLRYILSAFSDSILNITEAVWDILPLLTMNYGYKTVIQMVAVQISKAA